MRGKLDLHKYEQNGEDTGYRNYTKDGKVLCNRCNTPMDFREDMDERIGYYICPKCDFIEIDEYYDDTEDEDYELYWPDDEEEDEYE